MIDLDALQAAAEAAVELAEGALRYSEEDLHLTTDFEDVDVAFIAAANPGVVLELIARVYGLEVELDISRRTGRTNSESLIAERDAALARIARVEALHPRIVGECHTCSDENGPQPWPCPTVRALTEGEPSDRS